MTAGPWIAFGQFLEDESAGLHSLAVHELLVALVTNAWSPDVAADEVWGDISANEVDATGNGYAPQVTTGSLSRTGTTVTFDGTDVTFAASGAAIEDARYAVIYNSDSADRLVCYCLLDVTPADVDIPAGSVMRLKMHAAGIGQKAPA